MVGELVGFFKTKTKQFEGVWDCRWDSKRKRSKKKMPIPWARAHEPLKRFMCLCFCFKPTQKGGTLTIVNSLVSMFVC